MMDSAQVGADLGFDYETPDRVAAAVLTAMAEEQISVLPWRSSTQHHDRRQPPGPAGLEVKLAARERSG